MTNASARPPAREQDGRRARAMANARVGEGNERRGGESACTLRSRGAGVAFL